MINQFPFELALRAIKIIPRVYYLPIRPQFIEADFGYHGSNEGHYAKIVGEDVKSGITFLPLLKMPVEACG